MAPIKSAAERKRGKKTANLAKSKRSKCAKHVNKAPAKVAQQRKQRWRL